MNTKRISPLRTVAAAALLAFTAMPANAQLLKKGLNMLKKEAKKEVKKEVVDAADKATDGKLKQVTRNSTVNRVTNGKAAKLTRTTTGGVRRTPGKDYYTDDAWHEAMAREKENYAFKDTVINNIIYRLDPRDKTVSVYGVEPVMKHELTEVVIPSHIRHKGYNYKMVAVDKEALRDEVLLRKVTLPATITEIAEEAFSGDVKLEEINIPSSVKIIKPKAFSRTGMKKLVIPNGVKIIEGLVFAGSQIEEIHLPSSLTELHTYVFLGCEKLKRVVMAGGALKKIQGHCFQQCTALQTIVIPEGVEEIAEWAFMDCKSLTSVTFPKSLKKIGEDAFDNCPKLKTPMPAGVKVDSFWDD